MFRGASRAYTPGPSDAYWLCPHCSWQWVQLVSASPFRPRANAPEALANFIRAEATSMCPGAGHLVAREERRQGLLRLARKWAIGFLADRSWTRVTRVANTGEDHVARHFGCPPAEARSALTSALGTNNNGEGHQARKTKPMNTGILPVKVEGQCEVLAPTPLTTPIALPEKLEDFSTEIKRRVQSQCRQSVTISSLGKTYEFSQGEKIHMEVSRKYDETIINSIISGSDFHILDHLTDTKEYFSDYIFERI